MTESSTTITRRGASERAPATRCMCADSLAGVLSRLASTCSTSTTASRAPSTRVTALTRAPKPSALDGATSASPSHCTIRCRSATRKPCSERLNSVTIRWAESTSRNGA
jgi:hypothetical protein